jgi:hypothetical protein
VVGAVVVVAGAAVGQAASRKSAMGV